MKPMLFRGFNADLLDIQFEMEYNVNKKGRVYDLAAPKVTIQKCMAQCA